MAAMRDVLIITGAHTPIGAFQGELTPLPATQLGALAIRAALERARVRGDSIGEVYMGCVLPAGYIDSSGSQTLSTRPSNRSPMSRSVSVPRMSGNCLIMRPKLKPS